MKNIIRIKHYPFWIIALLILFSISSCKKDEEEVKPQSVAVNISFSSDIITPEAGQTMVTNLYYADISGSSVISSTPNIQAVTTLQADDIANGVTVSVEGILGDAEYFYICSYVDIDENGALNAGDLAAFYNDISLEEVELGQATPTNVAGTNSIIMDLDIIYALDELVLDIDNNVYSTVVIGDQEWFSVNLKTTKFRNGDDIPTGYTNEEWEELIDLVDGTGTPAYAQNPEAIPEDGLLYNWYAVADDREVCPTGWRTPVEDDWIELMMYAGMSEADANDYSNWDAGGDVGAGTKLKSATRDMGGTDNFGFNAIPSGMRSTAGTFSRYGLDFFFWSSSEDPTGESVVNGVRRAMRNTEPGVIRQTSKKSGGYAVRCVRDVE